MNMMDVLVSILTGGIGGALLLALLRGWITERLKQSIRHEYSQKLENHKLELNAKLQEILHANQLNQLRTSLFFDHQRQAFAEILAAIAHAVRKWWETYDPDEGEIMSPIPIEAYDKVKEVYYNHQLFLDKDCMAAIDLALEFMRQSLPVYYGDGPPRQSECKGPFDSLEFCSFDFPNYFRRKLA